MTKTLFIATALGALSLLASGTAQAADGKQLYDFYCAQCHGVDGAGKGPNVTPDIATTPRDFTNKAEMAKRTDNDITTVIKSGGPAISKSALMPPWGTTISDEEVAALVSYVRQFAK